MEEKNKTMFEEVYNTIEEYVSSYGVYQQSKVNFDAENNNDVLKELMKTFEVELIDMTGTTVHCEDEGEFILSEEEGLTYSFSFKNGNDYLTSVDMRNLINKLNKDKYKFLIHKNEDVFCSNGIDPINARIEDKKDL